MFILIPLIFIFLLFSYLQINNDVSLYTEIFIYCLIILIIVISFYLAKKIKADMHQQELNTILIEINRLKHKLNGISDDIQREGIINEINILTKEYDTKY